MTTIKNLDKNYKVDYDIISSYQVEDETVGKNLATENVGSTEAIIDCDAERPFFNTVLNGMFSVCPKDQISSRVSGLLTWNPDNIELYLDPILVSGKKIRGTEIRDRLKGKPVLSKNVLRHLVDNPILIPEAWKKYCIYFWGTIYRSDKYLFVHYLRWNKSRKCWVIDNDCLDWVWKPRKLAAILINN